jgi:tetratricopeptide (TPR) repeat protein
LTGLLNILLTLLALQSPPDSSSPVETADREFASLNYSGARTIYDSILATSRDSAIVLWKLARVCIFEGDVSSPAKKIKLYAEAKGFANRSVRADSLSSNGHAWLAASIGNIAMFEGGKTKVQLCHAIKREIDRALVLNPGNPLAYSILGSFYKALGDVSWIEKQLATIFLGGLPDGGYDESVIAFKKAIELAPDVVRNHYELGKVYMLQDKDGEAMVEFQYTVSLPIGIAMDCEMQRSAHKIIEELKQGHPEDFR